MTPRQITLARALGRCSFPPATSQKRFAKDVAHHAEKSPERPITARQAAYLCIMVHRYRRQLPTRILCLAQDEAEELEQNAPGNIGCPPRPKLRREISVALATPLDDRGANQLSLF